MEPDEPETGVKISIPWIYEAISVEQLIKIFPKHVRDEFRFKIELKSAQSFLLLLLRPAECDESRMSFWLIRLT